MGMPISQPRNSSAIIDDSQLARQENNGPALLDAARSRRVQPRLGGFQRRPRSRSARLPAPLPLPGRWLDGARSQSQLESHEESRQAAVPKAGSSARYPGNDGVDRKATSEKC